uniref:Peptidyl-prolyl cis-trans isomerase E n=1 Tax=Mesocestoides corti TaxID=53468 RepID=A0A5K3F8J6_MESCO
MLRSLISSMKLSKGSSFRRHTPAPVFSFGSLTYSNVTGHLAGVSHSHSFFCVCGFRRQRPLVTFSNRFKAVAYLPLFDAFFQWLTPAPTPTVLNSSFAQNPAIGSMASTWCSVVSLKA